jgi:glycosyltransferase involved in cell wall biosynthesis
MAIHLPASHGIAGFARNTGLQYVESDYVTFIDSDDFYDKNACELMYNYITKTNADMITTNYNYVDIDGNKWHSPIFDRTKFKSFKLLTDKDNYTDSFYVLCSAVWVKMFKRSFIEENNIKFLEGVPAEDAYFTFSSLLKSSNIYYLDDITVYYRQRNKNTEVKSISWNCSKPYFNKVNKAYKEIFKIFDHANRLDYYRYLYSKNLNYITYKFIDSTQLTNEEQLDILKSMHWFYEKSHLLKVEPVQDSIKLLVDYIIQEKYDEAITICRVIHEFRTYLDEKTRDNMSKPKQILYEKV